MPLKYPSFSPIDARFTFDASYSSYLYTYFLQNVKFHATKSRFHKYNIGVLALQRELLRTDENSRAPEICPVVPSRCVIFRNIFRMHQRRKYVSNISASDIVLCRGIPNSHESSTSRYIFYARIRVSLNAPVRLHCANTRGHAKEIACYSSIRSHGTFTFITAEQLALPLLMLRYGNPRQMRGGKYRYRYAAPICEFCPEHFRKYFRKKIANLCVSCYKT